MKACRISLGLGIAALVSGYVIAAAPVERELERVEPMVLKTNGGWCWFQDERAIVAGDQLIFGSVAGTDSPGSARGDVEATSVNLRTETTETFKLHPKFQSDDHDVPAFLTLPDGRILATYQSHGGHGGVKGTDLMRWRRTVEPMDISGWTEEQTMSVGAGVSYSNPFQLQAEDGRIYLFHRGVGFNPNYLISDDDTATFEYGGRLLEWPKPVGNRKFTGIDGGRPYVKYTQEGGDTIHVVTTEDHPRAFDNGIYHGFIKHGQWHGSAGAVLGPLSKTKETEMKTADLTPVFMGDADHVAWMCDVHVDEEGRPRILFSVQRGGAPYRGQRTAENDGQDHRYYYARWDGAEWRVREIAYAGRRLYAGEDDYTGLGAIDPRDTKTVYISTDAHPKTGEPLVSAKDGERHWEIYRGRMKDGDDWTWKAVTRDSTADNLRPIIPIWPEANGRVIVLWLRGEYRRYTDYDLDVVGLLPEAGSL